LDIVTVFIVVVIFLLVGSGGATKSPFVLLVAVVELTLNELLPLFN
jgi:hypothetical protein